MVCCRVSCVWCFPWVSHRLKYSPLVFYWKHPGLACQQQENNPSKEPRKILLGQWCLQRRPERRQLESTFHIGRPLAFARATKSRQNPKQEQGFQLVDADRPDGEWMIENEACHRPIETITKPQLKHHNTCKCLMEHVHNERQELNDCACLESSQERR